MTTAIAQSDADVRHDVPLPVPSRLPYRRPTTPRRLSRLVRAGAPGQHRACARNGSFRDRVQETRNSSAANATKALLREGLDRHQIPAAKNTAQISGGADAPLGSSPPEPEATAAVSVTICPRGTPHGRPTSAYTPLRKRRRERGGRGFARQNGSGEHKQHAQVCQCESRLEKRTDCLRPI